MTPRHPSIYLGAEPGPSRRSLEQLRDTIASPYGARLWQTVRQGAEESAGTDPLLPGTALRGRSAEQIRHANADNTICQAVVRRLLRVALVYLITGEERYRQDALAQMEALFDPQRWPQWLDFAHEMFEADLRTGQLGAGVALTYDWLYQHLSAAERTMIVEGLDRCAIRPYLATAPTNPHWLTRPSNWMTVVVGGLGIVGMVLGSDHDRSDLLVEMAQPRMEHYLTVLGPNGEFNESVGYVGSLQYPVRYFAARHSTTDGQEDRLAAHPLPQACRWLMHVTVPAGHTIPFGDSHAQGPLLIGYFAPIAAAARDGLLQWFLETCGLVHDPAADLTHVDVVDLLWYDPTLAATPPGGDATDSGELPRGAAFPGWGGLVASRSSWTDPDAVAVHGKAGREPIHEHQDDGQLIIHAGGAPLIVDLGSPSSYPADFFGENRARYYNASVRGHNLLQIGGREMRFEKPIEGTFLHTAFEEHGAAWSIDLTGAYGDVVGVPAARNPSAPRPGRGVGYLRAGARRGGDAAVAHRRPRPDRRRRLLPGAGRRSARPGPSARPDLPACRLHRHVPARRASLPPALRSHPAGRAAGAAQGELRHRQGTGQPAPAPDAVPGRPPRQRLAGVAACARRRRLADAECRRRRHGHRFRDGPDRLGGQRERARAARDVMTAAMTMERCLSELGADLDLLDEHRREELSGKGFALFTGIIEATWLELLRTRFEEITATEGERAGLEVHQEAGTRRLADLVNKGRAFDRVWSHPVVLAAVRHVIGAPFRLSSLNARDALPGEGRQALHQDTDCGALPLTGCNSIWMLDDFSADNGCTRLVPGSHRLGRPQDLLDDPSAPHPEQELIEAPAGSVAVFNSLTWHGGTLNRTRGAHRRAMHCFFDVRERPQQTDQRAYLRPETAARLTPAMRYLLDVD